MSCLTKKNNLLALNSAMVCVWQLFVDVLVLICSPQCLGCYKFKIRFLSVFLVYEI